jgi:phage antirepressor YoqD-like protein
MIRDLSQTLRAILTQPGLPAELAAAQIAFDRPTEQFNPSQTTVDLFLFDVQENKELRSNGVASGGN